VLFFGLSELALRAVNFSFELTGKARTFPGNSFENYYRKHPVWFWEFQPNIVMYDDRRGISYHINEQSLRAPRRWEPRKPRDVFRVLCLGDSCTFGLMLDRRQIYPERLQALLAARLGQTGCEVINAGVPGYSSYQGVRLLEKKFAAWDKDLVTVYFGMNDSDAAFLYGDAEQPSDRLLAVRRALEHSRLYQWLALWIAGRMRAHAVAKGRPLVPLTEDEWRKGRRVADRVRRRVTPDEMVHNYEHIAQLGREQGFRVLFMTCPYARRPDDPRTPFIRVLERYNEAIRQMVSQTNAALIDLDDIFRKTGGDALFVEGDPIHPNGQGHAVIAQAIFAEMERRGMIPTDVSRAVHSNSRKKCIASRPESMHAAGQSMQPR